MSQKELHHHAVIFSGIALQMFETKKERPIQRKEGLES